MSLLVNKDGYLMASDTTGHKTRTEKLAQKVRNQTRGQFKNIDQPLYIVGQRVGYLKPGAVNFKWGVVTAVETLTGTTKDIEKTPYLYRIKFNGGRQKYSPCHPKDLTKAPYWITYKNDGPAVLKPVMDTAKIAKDFYADDWNLDFDLNAEDM